MFRKFCSAIVEPGKQGRFKSLLNRDNRKIVCQLKSPTNGLNLLQIAVLLDDVATGNLAAFSRLLRAHVHPVRLRKQQHSSCWTDLHEQGVRHAWRVPLPYQAWC